MLYFSYGSNMHPAQMRERCPDHRVVGIGTLADRRLVFPQYSASWGGGVASVQLAHTLTVWGVLYDVSESDLKALDRYEGHYGPGDARNAYDRDTMNVDLVRPDDGSFPRRVRALVYVGRGSDPALPSRRYLDALLEGARHHRLPSEYVAQLAALPVAPDEPAVDPS